MIRPLEKNPLILSKVCEKATADDLSSALDLLDTIKAHQDTCVGMALNMIGICKRIIVVQLEDGQYLLMFNPEIIQTFNNPITKEEGCLCHEGTKTALRYDKIKVRYLDQKQKIKIGTYQGFTAQIIQHEIDHCNGILI